MDQNKSNQPRNHDINNLQHTQPNDPSVQLASKPTNNTPTTNMDGETTNPIKNKSQTNLSKKKKYAIKRRKQKGKVAQQQLMKNFTFAITLTSIHIFQPFY